jgi:hypothetical protein
LFEAQASTSFSCVIHAPLDDPLSSTNAILSPVAFGIRQIGFDFNHHIVTWVR